MTQTVEQLQQRISDLQSGTWVTCVYCGHRYGPASTTPVSHAENLKAHIAQCPEHPMAKFVKLARETLEMLDSIDIADPHSEAHSLRAKLQEALNQL